MRILPSVEKKCGRHIQQSTPSTRFLAQPCFVSWRNFLKHRQGLDGLWRPEFNLELRLAEERRVFIHQPRGRQLAVIRVEFHANAASSINGRGIRQFSQDDRSRHCGEECCDGWHKIPSQIHHLFYRKTESNFCSFAALVR